MYIFTLLPAISGNVGSWDWVEWPVEGFFSCRKFVAVSLNTNTMGFWRQLGEYLYIKKRDPNAPHTKWMQYMHGINRISIFMFLIALIIIAIRMIFFRK